MHNRELRRRFLAALWIELRIIWPILSGLVGLQVGLGVLVGLLERWPIIDGVYFAFVTGLTIGYGDLTPSRLITRAIAIAIGGIGVLLTALVAAIGVRALQQVT